MTDTIAIKGISQGLLITLPETNLGDDLLPQVRATINQRAAFFKGAQLVLDTRNHAISAEDLRQLAEEMEAQTIHLAGVLSLNAVTLDAAQVLQLPTDLADIAPPTQPTRPATLDAPPPNSYDDQEVDSQEYGTSGVLIKRTLRSGRSVRSRGHVVVIGDVNSGAEIIAAGDIIVWGKLRGIVHAGAEGDESAVVCALDLAPMQLRIASLISVPPQDKRRDPKPEMASINHQQIEANPWLP